MSGKDDSSYVGGELDLFAHAKNWKKYWSSMIRPYLEGDVLEVGAGIGANMRFLRTDRQKRWVCLEPDARLLKEIEVRLQKERFPEACELRHGTIDDLEAKEQFDVILYIDVMEHIPDDAGEAKQAARRLKRGGRLIVLSPAHQWLFSPFDAAIGHCRRYTKRTLMAAIGASLQKEKVRYLDCCGLMASVGNRLFLKQSMPTLGQILFWDRTLVTTSRLVDPLIFYSAGKSILGIWVKR